MIIPKSDLMFQLLILVNLNWFLNGIAAETTQLFYFSREFSTDKIHLTVENFEELIKDKPIKCIIHGWGENSEKAYFQQMTEEYLINDDLQIIQVDWRVLASRPYFQAAENTKIVGSYLGEMLAKVENLDQVHLIGHSLGAHVAGHAGRALVQRTGRTAMRISGLDPAGPHFELAAVGDRLCADDAAFVDVTHTDAGAFGLAAAVGHVDFYANGGRRPQPGCEPFGADAALQQLDGTARAFCSHTRSYAYFIASINGPTTLATQCAGYDAFKRGACATNSQIVFGEHVNASGATGKFYFDINERIVTPRRFEPGNFLQNVFKIAL